MQNKEDQLKCPTSLVDNPTPGTRVRQVVSCLWPVVWYALRGSTVLPHDAVDAPHDILDWAAGPSE